MRPKTKRPPIPKHKARYIIEDNGLTLKSYAALLGYKDQSALSHFLSGRFYSQRFWDDFFNRFQLRRAS